MHTMTYPQMTAHYKKIRRIIYTCVITFGLLNIFFPMTAHADVFGFYIPDVYADITENVQETNEILGKAFSFAQNSPYDVINSLVNEAGEVSSTGQIAINIRKATKTMALVTATLLLMVEFFRKTINFEWSSKWENILLFLIKIIVIKQVVQNADVIIGYIYAMFDSINKEATTTTINFLPFGTLQSIDVRVDDGIVQNLQKSWFEYWYEWGGDTDYEIYTYKIAPEAVRMFYPNATIPDATTTEINYDILADAFPSPTQQINFFPTWELVKLQPLFLIMKAIAYIVFVIVLGRVFELCLYTIFAPLPLATFASETTHDVAKNFIKNYIATVLQIAVIVAMFVVYVALNGLVLKWLGTPTAKWMNLIVLFALGLGVMSSGTWSRRICGIG